MVALAAAGGVIILITLVHMVNTVVTSAMSQRWSGLTTRFHGAGGSPRRAADALIG